MSAVSFPVRPSSTYRPRSPLNSFLRTGYQKTPTNRRGYHWAVDIPCPINEIIQLPEKAKLTRKGFDQAAGNYMEWEFLTGPWKGRYGRFFHMNRPCGFTVGTVKTRGYAVGRSGNTGNTSGPHVHFELAKYGWQHARDPRWDPTQAFRDAVAAKDY